MNDCDPKDHVVSRDTFTFVCELPVGCGEVLGMICVEDKVVVATSLMGVLLVDPEDGTCLRLEACERISLEIEPR